MLMLMMIATSLSFGQVVKKDSLYCRTISEEKEVIKTYQQKDVLDTLFYDCQRENTQLRIAISSKDVVINDLHRIIDANDTIISEKDTQISAINSTLKIEKNKRKALQVRNVISSSLCGISLIGNIVLITRFAPYW
jgi:hypothetical protein